MSKKSAPLKIWIIVGAVVTCLFLINYFVHNFSIERKNSKNKFENIDKEIVLRKVEKNRILVFGSSRMASALLDESFLNKKISSLSNTDVEVKVVTTPNAELEHLLDDIEVYKMIAIYNPSIIIIQKDLLLYNGRKHSVGGKIGVHFFRKALKGKRKSRNFTGYKESEDRWNPKLDSIKIDSKKFHFEKATFRKVPYSTNMDYILKLLIKRGTDLIAVEVPYPQKIMNRKLELGIAADENNILSRLTTSYGIVSWDNRETYFFQDYHDFTHFNSQGKERFTNWFISNMSEYMKE